MKNVYQFYNFKSKFKKMKIFKLKLEGFGKMSFVSVKKNLNGSKIKLIKIILYLF